jgi:uncharacterized protein (DUF58 family)
MKPVLLLSGLIYLLIISALVSLNGLLLALVLPLLIYLGTGLFFGPVAINLSIQRQISVQRVLPGNPVEVRLWITNQGADLETLHIHERVPHGIEVSDGETELLGSLKAGHTLELAYTFKARRGYYRFRDVKIQAWDQLGMQSQTTTLDAEGHVYVQPPVKRIGRVNIRPRSTRVYAGFIPARKGGPGVEFFGVRQFQQGDPLRWINWHASARHQQAVFINQFELERVADVGIILDTRLRSEVRANGGESLFDCSVQAAASLADSFLNDGNRVGLLLYGTQLDWTYPAYGKVQRERILLSLARAKPGDSMVFEKLANLPKRLFPPNAQLVLISPLHSDDLPVLVHLRARGYALMVISPDPVSFEIDGLDLAAKHSDTAQRLARLERTLMQGNRI